MTWALPSSSSWGAWNERQSAHLSAQPAFFYRIQTGRGAPIGSTSVLLAPDARCCSAFAGWQLHFDCLIELTHTGPTGVARERAAGNRTLCSRPRCPAALGRPYCSMDGTGALYERWSGLPTCTPPGPDCQRRPAALGFDSATPIAAALLRRRSKCSCWELQRCGCWATAGGAATALAGGRHEPLAAAARCAARCPALRGEVAPVRQEAAAMAAVVVAVEHLAAVPRLHWRQPRRWPAKRMSSFWT